MDNIWQKCPICNSEGKVLADGFINSVYQDCKVCKGKMIISKLTGLPPDYEANKKLHDIFQKPSDVTKNEYPLGKEKVYLEDRQAFKDSTDMLRTKLNENTNKR